MRQFKTLTDPEKIQIQPARLRVYTARASGSLRNVLQSIRVPETKLEETSILNGKTLGDPIEANALIKVVEGGI